MSTRPTGLAAHRPHVAGVPCTLAMTGPAAAVRPVVVAGAGGCCGGRQDAGVAARGRGNISHGKTTGRGTFRFVSAIDILHTYKRVSPSRLSFPLFYSYPLVFLCHCLGFPSYLRYRKQINIRTLFFT